MKNRLFLAIPAVLDDYEAIINDFSWVVSGRWVPPQNLHLTVSFFGDLLSAEALQEKLSALPFEVTPSLIRGLGYFRKSGILYGKVENPSLERVYREVDELFGLPVKEHFTPHVTLLHSKFFYDEEHFYGQLALYRDKPLGHLENELLLMQSELHSDGAKYRAVKRFGHDHH
jgi:2'-5' RNA ligase